jgi:chromosomal replication initiation ATPase DnaA
VANPARRLPGFIGRNKELAYFRRLAGLDPAEEDERSGLVVVWGATGTGKRELLKAFEWESRTHTPARCSEVVDLPEAEDLERMLEQLALALSMN